MHDLQEDHPDFIGQSIAEWIAEIEFPFHLFYSWRSHTLGSAIITRSISLCA